MYYYRVISSPFGPLTAAEDAAGIFMLWFGAPEENFKKAVKKLTKMELGTEGGVVTERLSQQLSAYFSGQLQSFDVPLSLYGTAFQKSVWLANYQVPFGKMVHYGDLANQIGNPRACRAIGGAMGKNPIPIVVPCHRVVGKSGALTGFSAPGGLLTKIKLLELEGIHYEI